MRKIKQYMKSLSGYCAAMRAVGGTVGGFIGTALIGVVAVLASGLLGSLFSEDSAAPAMVVILLFIMTFFIASLISSGVSFAIMSKVDSERFYFLGPAIMKMLVANIIIFVLLLPAYFIGGTFNSFFIPVIGVVHFVFSAIFSFFTFELEARTEKRPMLSLFGTLVGGLIGSILIVLFFSFAGRGNTLAFLVPIIPLIMWVSLAGFSALFEILYEYIYRYFGIDLFASSGYDRTAFEQDIELQQRLSAEEAERASHME